MSNFGGVLKIGGIVIAVVAAGVLIGWLGSRTTPASKPPEPIPSIQTPGNPAQPGSATTVAAVPAAASNSITTSSNLVQRGSSSGTLTNWEDRIDNILGSEGEESAKAKEMLGIFPQLPPEGQVEVAQHLSNLVLDEDYSPLGALLTNASLSEDVLDVLMGDLLNRPNSLKLPMLVDIARNGQHPKGAEARDLLELFLEEDYGNDWNLWQAKAQEWLQANPD